MPRITPKRIAEFSARFRVEPGRRVRLPRDFDPSAERERSKEDAERILAQGVELLAEYQARLAAQDTYALVAMSSAIRAPRGRPGTSSPLTTSPSPAWPRRPSSPTPSSRSIHATRP